jgi:hypothetical protein
MSPLYKLDLGVYHVTASVACLALHIMSEFRYSHETSKGIRAELYLLLDLKFYPEDGGSMSLRNVSELADCIAPLPGRVTAVRTYRHPLHSSLKR